MPHKQALFHSATREKVLRGASLLIDAVRVTLGPKSKSVLIQKSWYASIVCNDGVTTAKEFDLKDPEENLGAQVHRQAAEKTGDIVGDGHVRSRKTRRPMAASSWRVCWAVRAISALMPRARNMSISFEAGIVDPAKVARTALEAQYLWPASCCSPRRQ
jgi:chaperonin GroEL (HSP60 family)